MSNIESSFRVVYQPWGASHSFNSVEKFLSYCKKLDNNTCRSLIEQRICRSWKDAVLTVSGWNKEPFWRHNQIRFGESINSKLVEVYGKEVLIGISNHYYSFEFDSCVEALQEGEKAAKLAIELGIGLSSASRTQIDELVKQFELI